ncbi:MAG: hypothetical protein DMF77_00550 [Acidobacteria bacterium]|nr:MAG: hypothetical protein DMF77_00550 [Acidobacteriota bacterium]
MNEEKKAVNFTIVPDEDHTTPIGEREIQEAQSTHLVRAPVRARMVVPVQMIPGLIAALQENFRLYQESFGPPKGPTH